MNHTVKQEFHKVCGIFLLSLIVYGVIISFFTATVYVNVDEELYVALAKSFHYSGRFEVNGKLTDYNCVLYSLLLSLAYFFYSPEKILFIMRFIGVVCMCSSVFPIWLLAGNLLKREKEVLMVCGLSMLMPYMFDCVYLIQEVLSYPLFLWSLYFLYLGYGQLEEKQTGKAGELRWFAAGAVFSVLCFFTKTYMFFIPAVLNVSLLWDAWKKKKMKRVLMPLCVYDGIYLTMTGGLYVLILAVNGFAKGNNHYAGQFSWLFPITGWTVVSGIVCLIIYFALLVINMGLLPIISVWVNRKKYEKAVEWLGSFVLMSLAFLLFEIVVLIVLTEEGVPTVPHKFLFRYFHVLVPPVLILFVGDANKQDVLKTKVFFLLSVGSCAISFIYFIGIRGNTRQAIADGYFYLLLENITKNILPYADAITVFLAGCMLTVISVFAEKRKESILKIFIRFGIVGIIFLWLVNCVQLPVYNNRITDGKTTQRDSIEIADYLNENEYEFVYYVVTSIEESDSYVRNFYGYLKQQHQVIYPEELGQILKDKERGKAAFLVSVETAEKELEVFQLKKVELPLKKLTMYCQEF